MRKRTKASLLGGATVLTAFGLAAVMAIPANADPNVPNPTSETNEAALVGVGSDTIQDLFTGLTQVVVDHSSGATVFASYDATAPGTTAVTQIQPRVLGKQFDRPNGSGQGLTALRSAVQGTTWTDNGANVVLKGSDIQFARSSSFNTPVVSNGTYAQIPIAVDAVTYATNGSTASETTPVVPGGPTTPGTVIPQGIPVGGTPTAAAGTTAAPDPLTLSNIFDGKGFLQGKIGDTTYQFFSGAGASSDQTNWPKLDVYVPQSGSGTRNFWYQALGLGDNTQLPPGVQDHKIDGSLNEEHDGSAIFGDPLAIAPFSIAQWNAQSNVTELNGDYGTSVIDRRHDVVLNAVSDSSGNLIQPKTSAGILNTAFPVSRPVFVITEFAQLKINPYLEGSFVSDSNFAVSSSIYDATNPVTGATSVINDFGFAQIPSAGFTTPVYPGVTFKQGDPDDYRIN